MTWRASIPAALLLAASRTFGALSAEDAQFFADKIQPLIEERCYKCHSHQSGKMKNGLTLDSRDGWAAGGDSGPAIVPGDVEKSLLVRAIRHSDPDLKMPKEKLPAAEIAALEEWVKRGAPDPREAPPVAKPAIVPGDWWSLKPLVRPSVPDGGSPSPIDAFIQEGLHAKGLTLSYEASRRTLIRRLYLDLLGLPPAPEEVDAFVASTDPQAYEKLVDALLASPRYGERWARHWFDVIHFADTHGFEHDLLRPNAWRYRDYVIDRFNGDVAWPRFIREQLAADALYPGEPKLAPALGFLGAGPYDSSAAGTAPKSFEYMDRDDLVTQTMSAFASTTVNCARCHAHKFDPIPQEDYFALQAVFSGIGKGDITYDESPGIAQERRRWQALLDAAKASDAAVLLSFENEELVTKWERLRGESAPWLPLAAESSVAANGATLSSQPDASISASGTRADVETYTITFAPDLSEIAALRLDLLTDDLLPAKGPGRADNGNMHLSEFEAQVLPHGGGPPEKAHFCRATADFEQVSYGVAKAIDGDPKTSWAIHPKVGEPHQAVFELGAPLALDPGAKLVVVLKQLQGGSHLIGRFRISATNSVAGLLALPPLAESALRKAHFERSKEEQVGLASAVLRQIAEDALARLPPPLKVYAAARRAENERGVITFPEPRIIHLLSRGDLEKPLAEIGPGALSAVAVLPSRFQFRDPPHDESARRAALAEWLADPRNPLVWRSIANRVWQYHFGCGLCNTPSDFGRMGGFPSHPALLDWLASELRDSGGSLKRLHRLICNSAAYRQASADRDGIAAVDPDDRLLWRMNRPRMDADQFYDSVLAVSGRLDLAAGGPSIPHFRSKPGPQDTPILDYTAFDWDTPGASRRSIYRVVWRGITDPFLDALDFPDAAMAAPVRGFSASPLQALELMNDDFVLRHSERFAQRLEEQGTGATDRIRAAFRLALSREPNEGELVKFKALADRHSFAAVCRVLFNSDEFLFID